MNKHNRIKRSEIAKIKDEHDAFHWVALESFSYSEAVPSGLLKSVIKNNYNTMVVSLICC